MCCLETGQRTLLRQKMFLVIGKSLLWLFIVKTTVLRVKNSCGLGFLLFNYFFLFYKITIFAEYTVLWPLQGNDKLFINLKREDYEEKIFNGFSLSSVFRRLDSLV